MSQTPAHRRNTTMAFIATVFLGSTLGMLAATAWEVLRRGFGRHPRRDA
jgi:hypothetical protein